MACLRCDNLALGYEQHVVARNISFTLSLGDYLCVVGENGAGKSTLMKTLLGLQKPLGGTLTPGPGFRREYIGYLPQQTRVQKDFPATVEEVVRSGLAGRLGRSPFYRARHKARAAAAMERLGIAALARRSYRELSGGQQQRVLLARALCATHEDAGTALLLLDEPAAGLDPAVTEELYALIQRLNGDGMTVIMITHDMRAAARYATHVLYVGAQPFFGTRDAFLHSPQGRRFAAGEETL